MVAVLKPGLQGSSRKQARHVEENDNKWNEENVGDKKNWEEGSVDISQPQSPDSSFDQMDFDSKKKIEGGRRKSDLDLMAFVLNICPLPPKYAFKSIRRQILKIPALPAKYPYQYLYISAIFLYHPIWQVQTSHKAIDIFIARCLGCMSIWNS